MNCTYKCMTSSPLLHSLSYHFSSTPSSAMSLTGVRRRNRRGVVGIFWDIENCAVPHGKCAGGVAERVRALPGIKGRAEMEFLVVCDVTKEQEEVVNDLNSAQVTVQHVAAGKKKNAADEKLRQAMRKFVDAHDRDDDDVDVALVLISGDQDFLPDLSDFRRRRGVHVILLHNRVTPDNLRRAADEALDFHDLLWDVPARSTTAGPLQYTELEISNVPSARELSGANVEKKLEELAKAWHGKVRHLNESDSTAVLKFENGEKASRALRNLQGETLGRRALQVDFNRRPNFVLSRQQHPDLQFQEQQVPPAAPVVGGGSGDAAPDRKKCVEGATGAKPKIMGGRPVAAVRAVNAEELLATSTPLGGAGELRRSAFTPVRPGGSVGAGERQVQLEGNDLRVVRNLRAASRRVQQLGGGGGGGMASTGSSSEDVLRSGEHREERRKVRMRRRSRQRRRKSGSGHSRNSSCDSLVDAMRQFGLEERRGGLEQSRRPEMIISNIVMDGKSVGKEEAERTLKTIITGRGVSFSSFKFVKMSSNAYRCNLEVEDLGAGMHLVKELNEFPFGLIPIKVEFGRQEDAIHARAVSILKMCGGDQKEVSLDEFSRRYEDKFEESITLHQIVKCPQISLITQMFNADILLRLKVAPDSSSRGDGPVSKTQSFYESSSCTPVERMSSSSGIGAGRNGQSSIAAPAATVPRQKKTVQLGPRDKGLCLAHDKSRGEGPDYILPSVQVSRKNLKERLKRALAAHPDGIPRRSLLHCLNATADQVGLVARVAGPEQGGVPLEQVLDTLDATDVCDEGLVINGDVDEVVKGRRKKRGLPTPEKPEALKKLVHSLLSVLESAPFHRLQMFGELGEQFRAQSNKDIDEACRLFGGIGEVIRLNSDAFRIIGRGRKSVLVFSPATLRSAFTLVVRKILAHMDGSSRSFSASDAAAFSLLHQRHLRGRVFRPSDYGACSLSDLLEEVASIEGDSHGRRSIIRVKDGRVRLSEDIEDFVRKASAVLEAANGHALGVGQFDQAYTARFGNYSVPDLGYTGIEDLFDEFTTDLELLRGADKATKPLLSLSKKRKLSLLDAELSAVLKKACPETAVRLDSLEDAFYAHHRRDLGSSLSFLPAPDLAEAVQLMQAEVRSELDILNDQLVLSCADFWCRLEKRVLAVLFLSHSASMSIQSGFVPAYRHLFGADCFLDLSHVMFGLCSPGPNFFLVHTKEEDSLSLAPLGTTLVRLSRLLAGTPDLELEEPALIWKHRTVYDLAPDYQNYPCLADLASAFPDFFYVTSSKDGPNCIGLSSGGEYLVGLLRNKGLEEAMADLERKKEARVWEIEPNVTQESIKSTDSSGVLTEPSNDTSSSVDTTKKKKNRRSRLAPNFNVKM